MNPPTQPIRYTLAVLFAVNLLNFYDRAIFGALAEPIRRQWELNDSQIGWLATAFTLLYAMVGVPFGRLADGWKRPQLLGLGLAAWSILTAASGMAWNFNSLFLARLGVGVGEAACAPAANSLIGDLFPPARRARALAIFMLGLPAGNFLGTFVSGMVAAAYGWQAAFAIACVPGLLLVLPVMRLPDPPRGAAESSLLAGRSGKGSAIWAVLRIPSIRWIALTGALYNSNMYAVAAFLPAYLSRYHGLDLKQSNITAAVLLGGSGVAGILLGGWAADRVAPIRANGRLLVCAAAALVMAVLIALALLEAPGQVILFVLLMGAGCMVGYVYYAAVYATIQDLVPPRLRGTAMALYFLVMYMLGGSFGPVVTGKLSDHFARRAMAAAGVSTFNEHFRAAGLHSAMYGIAVCSGLLVVVLLCACRTLPGDMRASEAWMTAREVEPAAGAPK